MGWKTDVYSDMQETFMKMQEATKYSSSEKETTARLFRGYDRYCIRQGLAYVEDMTDEEFDEFALFLSGRSHILVSDGVKMLETYFSFLQTAKHITPDVCKSRTETLKKIVQASSRSKYKKSSDFITTSEGKTLTQFFYVSPEHLVSDIKAISPSRDYNSAIVIVILGWSGLTSDDIAVLSESQVASDCSTVHINDRDVAIPSVMQQILRDYRESDIEFSLPDSGDTITKVMSSSLFVKKRKSGSRQSSEKNYKATNTITIASIQQKAREFSNAVSTYRKIPLSLNVRKITTFGQLYEMDKQIAASGQSAALYVKTLGLSDYEQMRAIRMLTERKTFIDTNEDVKPFL